LNEEEERTELLVFQSLKIQALSCNQGLKDIFYFLITKIFGELQIIQVLV
jgi:hypothetical protein